MRNMLRRPRTVVVATALAGSLVLGIAAAAHADFSSPDDPTSAPSVASPPTATAATATTVDAATDAETAAAATCSTTYLSLGSTGTCVRLLQKNLGGLTVTGTYGSGTRSRVRSFQDDTGLTVDGKVGPQTWRKLRTYGKAIGWVSGVTVYMCKWTAGQFRYFTWNNSGRRAHWSFYASRPSGSGMRFDGPEIVDDRIAHAGVLNPGAYDSTSLMVWLGINDIAETGATVRGFARNTLPACG